MCVSAERQQRKQEREKQRDRFHTEALRSLISHRTGRRSLPEPFRSPRDGIYIVESLPTGLEQAARAFGEILHKPSNVGCGCQNLSRRTGERAGRSWSRPTPAPSRLPAPPRGAAGGVVSPPPPRAPRLAAPPRRCRQRKRGGADVVRHVQDGHQVVIAKAEPLGLEFAAASAKLLPPMRTAPGRRGLGLAWRQRPYSAHFSRFS